MGDNPTSSNIIQSDLNELDELQFLGGRVIEKATNNPGPTPVVELGNSVQLGEKARIDTSGNDGMLGHKARISFVYKQYKSVKGYSGKDLTIRMKHIIAWLNWPRL